MYKTSRYFAKTLFLCFLASGAHAQPIERTVLPGDLLQISCEQDGELCVSRVVNSDGKILLPFMGAIGVATLTPSQIQDKLLRTLQDMGGFFASKVEVRPIYLAGEMIGVEGAVRYPIHLRFARGIPLSAILGEAQPTDLADLFRIQVSHANGSMSFVSSKDPLRLIDGDRVIVPISTTSHSVEVVGGVNKPCQLDYRDGLTLGSALEAAEGFAPRGVGSRILVERLGEAIPVSIPDDAQFELKIGDRVRVEVAPELRHVVVAGAVNRPGLVDLLGGMTLTQAIAASGGMNNLAKGNDTIWLKRNSVRGFSKPIKLSYRLILSGRVPDPILSVNDVIEVGSSDLKSQR